MQTDKNIFIFKTFKLTMAHGPDPDWYDSDDSLFDDDNYFIDNVPKKPPELTPEQKRQSELDNFYRAITSNDTKTVKEFLNNGFDVDTDLKDGWTPLLLGSCSGNIDLIRILIEKGARVNQERDAMTPLMLACSCPNYSSISENTLEVAKLLIENGANVKSINRKRKNALMLAASSGNIQTVQYLLPLSDKNALDNQGWSALVWAISTNQIEIVKYLLEEDFPTDITDVRGNTPFDVARDNDFTEIIKLFPTKDSDDVLDILQYSRISYEEEFRAGDKEKNFKPMLFNEIANILLSVNCEYLLPLFKEKKVTLEQFLCVTDEELKEIGVKIPFQRYKILEGLYMFHRQPYHPKSVHVCINNKNLTNVDVATQMTSAVYQLTAMSSSLKFISKNLKELGDDEREKIFQSLKKVKQTLRSYKITYGKLNQRIYEWDKSVESPDLITKDSIKSHLPWKKMTICLGILGLVLIIKIKNKLY